jgi:hypothetical protein
LGDDTNKSFLRLKAMPDELSLLSIKGYGERPGQVYS